MRLRHLSRLQRVPGVGQSKARRASRHLRASQVLQGQPITGAQHLSSQPADPSALSSQTEQLQHTFADPVRQAMDNDADEDKDREELDEETLATMLYNQ